jgi:hypothetical protein
VTPARAAALHAIGERRSKARPADAQAWLDYDRLSFRNACLLAERAELNVRIAVLERICKDQQALLNGSDVCLSASSCSKNGSGAGLEAEGHTSHGTAVLRGEVEFEPWQK